MGKTFLKVYISYTVLGTPIFFLFFFFGIVLRDLIHLLHLRSRNIYCDISISLVQAKEGETGQTPLSSVSTVKMFF